MKKIGSYTAKGIASHLIEEKILLDDGAFNTGYVVTGFQIYPTDFTGGNPSTTTGIGRLATNSGLSLIRTNFIDASLNEFVAADSISGGFENVSDDARSFIDPDNLIVQDLFITILNAADKDMNYLIKMDKYEFTDWRGALAITRNKSQDV
jgi:hypothetical protein